MYLKGIVMTTRPDRHGRRMAKGSFGPLAEEASSGPCTPVTIEHDRSIPPVGKILNAHVEVRPDGEEDLVSVQEIFDGHVRITLPDGTAGFRVESRSDRRPFQDIGDVQTTTLAIDAINLSSEAELADLTAELKRVVPEEFETTHRVRQSLVPDPELVITLAKTAVLAIAGKKTAELLTGPTIEKFGKDVAKIYDFVREAMVRCSKRLRPKDRPITYVVEMPGDPSIEFVAVATAREPHPFLEAFSGAQREEALRKAAALHATFPATRIQFLLGPDGGWRFNFLLARDGAVIGTDAALKRQALKLQARHGDPPATPPVE